jgi:hypothetical protein
MLKSSFLLGLFIMLSCVAKGQDTVQNKWELDFSAEVELENQFYYNKALYPDQKDYFLSGAFKPILKISSTDGKHFIKVEPFFRGSIQDPNRTHWDIRQAYYQVKLNSWTITTGIRKVFWGVTESNHLVDIINQTDVVEGTDGKQKLGQSMVQISKNSKWGNFEFFYLPYSRRIQLSSKTGRNRFPLVIEREDIPFRSVNKEWHPSFAVRWSKTLGDFSFGVSHFYGSSREPLFLGFNLVTGLDLSYPIINQSGIDIQYNKNACILKLESIYRISDYQEFVAFTTGIEYTFGNIFGKGADIGLVSEYTYDSRQELTFSGLDNDVFIGTRIALNDDKSTDCLIGGIYDVEKHTTLFRVAASRRVAKSFKVELKVNVLTNVSDKEILYNFRNDDLLELKIQKYF